LHPLILALVSLLAFSRLVDPVSAAGALARLEQATDTSALLSPGRGGEGDDKDDDDDDEEFRVMG
jgi:hypothetical protein